jgi:hypothetical protein
MLNPYYKTEWENFIKDHTYSKFFTSERDTWLCKLEELKQYISTHNKRPSRDSKDAKVVELGRWLVNQTRNYQRNTDEQHDRLNKSYVNTDEFSLKSNPNDRNIWENFITDPKYSQYFDNIAINPNPNAYTNSDSTYQEYWISKLNELKQYIQINNKRPSQSDSIAYNKQLAKWLHKQIYHYRYNITVMLNPIIKKLWEEFVADPVYKIAFVTNEEKWEEKHDELISFIRKEHRLPKAKSKSDTNIEACVEHVLRTWYTHQIAIHKTQMEIMGNKLIYDKWAKFTSSDEFKKYFLTFHEEWAIRLNEVKDFMDTHKKRPMSNNPDIMVKKLDRWIRTQNSNYKKKTNIMLNSNIYDQWTKFILDDKYKNLI